MIFLKSKSELQIMRQAGRIVAETLNVVSEKLRPGLTTADLDRMIDAEIRKRGATPSFLGLYGFPGSACISVNEEVVHGIPGKRVLHEGDVVKLDAGAFYRGFHGDGAWTFPVGKTQPEIQRLLEVTHTALFKGLAQVKPDGRTYDIVHAIQSYVEGQGMNLARDLTGHGVGRHLHEQPDIPNWLPPSGPKPRNYRLRPGMTFAVEPMVILGGWETYIRPDKWTVVSYDRSWSAHFEHTIAVTEKGYEILTLP